MRQRLADYPAVALDGPRHAGKTTLARSLGGRDFVLEHEGDRTRLDIPWTVLAHGRKLRRTHWRVNAAKRSWAGPGDSLARPCRNWAGRAFSGTDPDDRL